MLSFLTLAKGKNSRKQSPMTEVHRYWTNLKDLVEVAALEEAAVVAVDLVEVVVVLLEVVSEGVVLLV